MISRVLRFVNRLKTPCHILIVNTYLVPLGTPPERLVEVNDRLREESIRKLRLEQEFAYMQANFPIQIQTASIMGSITNVVSELAVEKKIDLLVMGRNSRPHIVRTIMALKRRNDISLMVRRQLMYPGEVFLIFFNGFLSRAKETNPGLSSPSVDYK